MARIEQGSIIRAGGSMGGQERHDKSTKLLTFSRPERREVNRHKILVAKSWRTDDDYVSSQDESWCCYDECSDIGSALHRTVSIYQLKIPTTPWNGLRTRSKICIYRETHNKEHAYCMTTLRMSLHLIPNTLVMSLFKTK